MSHLTPIIFILLALKNTEGAVTPVVTLSPNWNYVYSGDQVTLSCNVGSVEENKPGTYYYTWYKEDKVYMKEKSRTFTAKVEHTGVYECSVEYGIYSKPVLLHVISGDKSDRPFVTMSPNWGMIFRDEMMTMTCNTTKSPQQYVWKKGGKQIKEQSNKEFIITTAQTYNRGNYQCGFGGNDLSFPVTFEVNDSDYLILQAPSNIIEGDSLNLRCHNRPGSTVTAEAIFYKDKELSGLRNGILHIPNVNTSMSGTYTCKKLFSIDYYYQLISAEKYIYVQDLFSSPEIKNDPFSVREGDHTTLTCHTRLNPLRGGTELHFAFYRDGLTVQEFSLSNTYSVPSCQLEDSGNYTCEVRTASDTVRKMSNVKFIQIQEVFTSPQISAKTSLPVYEFQKVTIECESKVKVRTSLLYTFYKDSKMIRHADRKTSYVIDEAGEEHTGTYQCSVQSQDGKIKKNSTNLHVLVQSLLTLQTPSDVVEGDHLSLKCHSEQKYKTSETFYFYKDYEMFSSTDDILYIPNVTTAASGRYKCTKYFQDIKKWMKTAETFISVKELFSTPEIQTSNSIQEGDEMTVTCHTRLNPLRGGTELHFAFYRDGWTVRGYDGSDTYRVRSAQLEDSGKYTCEVRTANYTVRKDSNTSHIQVQELFTSPEIRVDPSLPVEEGGQVTLKCMTIPKGSTSLLYIFYKDSQIVQSDYRKTSYVIGKADEEHTGSYQCSVKSWDGKVRKNSTNIYILVQSPISGVNITVDKNDFVYGESLTLNCSVEYGTSPVFLWLHNETVVDQDSEFYQLRDNGAVLYIKSLQSHHVGTYRCQVSNKLSDSESFFVLKTFQISQASENPPLGRNIIWPVLGVLMLTLLIITILLFVKRRKLSSLFLSLNRQQNQQNSESTFDKDRPRDDGRSANEGTNGPNETDNQHLYGNVSLQEEEDDICYTYIDISKIQGPTNTKEEPSVVYSVLQPPGASMGSQATQETDDSANIYQNFNAEQH